MSKHQFRHIPLPSNLDFCENSKGKVYAAHLNVTATVMAGRGTVQQILYLGPRMRWVVNATPHPLYILTETW